MHAILQAQDLSGEEDDTPAWSRGHRPGSTIKKKFLLQSRDVDHEDEVEDLDDEDDDGDSQVNAWQPKIAFV